LLQKKSLAAACLTRVACPLAGWLAGWLAGCLPALWQTLQNISELLNIFALINCLHHSHGSPHTK
jgi:hypothetical protein